MNQLRLKGRAALVTGGAVRLGKALALRLAAEGADVAIHYYSSAAAAHATHSELMAHGVRATTVQADLAEEPAAAAQRVVAEARAALGPLDLLVNSAAIFEPQRLDDLTPQDWERHERLNLQAPLWLAQAFARQLPDDRNGDILNLVDWRALRPQPGHLSYTLAKAGLVAATRLLAQELAPRIRVNAIAPGAILPPAGSNPETFAALAACIPLGRTGSPDDVADALVYLVTAPFVTGEVLCITGGQQL